MSDSYRRSAYLIEVADLGEENAVRKALPVQPDKLGQRRFWNLSSLQSCLVFGLLLGGDDNIVGPSIVIVRLGGFFTVRCMQGITASPNLGLRLRFGFDDSITVSRGPTVKLSWTGVALAGRSSKARTSFLGREPDDAYLGRESCRNETGAAREMAKGPITHWRAGGPRRLSIDGRVLRAGREMVIEERDGRVEVRG